MSTHRGLFQAPLVTQRTRNARNARDAWHQGGAFRAAEASSEETKPREAKEALRSPPWAIGDG